MKCVLLALLLTGGAVLPAADVVPDATAALLAAAAQARTQAEADLTAEREKILTERTAALAAVDTLAQRLAAVREQQAKHELETAALVAANTRAHQIAALADAQAQQQLQHAAQLLGLTALPAAAGERTAAITAALVAEPARLVASATVRTAQETVQDRTGHPVQVPVLRLGAARAWAAGDTPETSGALQVQAGIAVISGPPLPPELRAVLSDPQRVLLDVSGTWAAQAALPHRTLGEWLRGGRTFIWPILAVGVIGVVLALLRTLALARCRLSRPALDQAAAWFAGAQQAPLATDGAQPLGRVLAVGVATLGLPREAREAALDRAILAEAPQLQRGLGILLLLASIAPLLGLLGTVTGMIDLFSVIGAQGSGNARALSGGISEALITTQAGMLVAVPLLVAHSLLNRAAERRLLQLEEAASAALGATGTTA